MTEFKIDTGIPIPRKTTGLLFPFDCLEVGQSFFVGIEKRNIWAAKIYASKVLGKEFTARTVTENGVKGVRVWRTA